MESQRRGILSLPLPPPPPFRAYQGMFWHCPSRVFLSLKGLSVASAWECEGAWHVDQFLGRSCCHAPETRAGAALAGDE